MCGLYTLSFKHCVTHGVNVVHRCGREFLICLRSSCTRLAGPKQLHSSTAPSLNATEIAQRVIRGSTLGSAPGTFLQDRKSTRLNSSHVAISYAVFCLKKKKDQYQLRM